MQCVVQFQLIILAIILAIIQLIILAIIQLIILAIIQLQVQVQAHLTAFLIKLVKNDIVRRPKEA